MRNSESDTNSNMEQVRTRVETLRQALMKFDKDLDDQIDQQELLNFLDSNMKDGRKFDRNLSKKIFSVLDLDNNGKISVEEFIKSFVQIEEEIKNHSKELQAKYNNEKENNAKLFKLMMENQNEKLNSEEIGPNGKITIEITNIEFLTTIKNFQGISIRVRFGNEMRETKILSSMSNLTWKEKFEL
jgi:Ca2+-binding EF-hand superfamily protein